MVNSTELPSNLSVLEIENNLGNSVPASNLQQLALDHCSTALTSGVSNEMWQAL